MVDMLVVWMMQVEPFFEESKLWKVCFQESCLLRQDKSFSGKRKYKIQGKGHHKETHTLAFWWNRYIHDGGLFRNLASVWKKMGFSSSQWRMSQMRRLRSIQISAQAVGQSETVIDNNKSSTIFLTSCCFENKLWGEISLFLLQMPSSSDSHHDPNSNNSSSI